MALKFFSLFLILAFIGCGVDETDEQIQDAEFDDNTLRITGFSVIPNPRSAISGYALWTTNVPATSSVEFGETGEFGWRISDEELVTNHIVFIFGMHAETDYSIRAISTAPGLSDAISQSIVFTTGSLPESVIEGEVNVNDEDSAYSGWTLTNVYTRHRRLPATAVMYDMSGRAVWYCIPRPSENAGPGLDLSLVDDDRVLFGPARAGDPPVEVSLACETIWQGPKQESNLDGLMHHHFEKLENGNYLTLKKDARRVNGEIVIGDIVIEMTPKLDVVWSWNVWDHLKPEEGDWTHGNSATVDFDEGAVYYNSRHLSALFKIRRTGGMFDGTIIWRLGGGGDFSADPDSVLPWFVHAHAPEIQANGNVLIYDNGNPLAFFPAGETRKSRVLEYALDEENMEARIVWEFPGDFDVDDWYRDQWYTPYWGDADRLPNGNILINAGTDVIGRQSRIFEVTANGVVVWEFEFPSDEHVTYGSYRAERITPPLLEEISGEGV